MGGQSKKQRKRRQFLAKTMSVLQATTSHDLGQDHDLDSYRVPLISHQSHENLNRVPLINSAELQLRFLSPDDLPEVKRLCKEWFPIEYPDAWYACLSFIF